mmetsp:Transcript_8073/g.25805  ORF Transcript_8073/g.25805 Transcript_8073/m.25805 type:complete len:227 (-) Transcript_8073:346-1026(-)
MACCSLAVGLCNVFRSPLPERRLLVEASCLVDTLQRLGMRPRSSLQRTRCMNGRVPVQPALFEYVSTWSHSLKAVVCSNAGRPRSPHMSLPWALASAARLSARIRRGVLQRWRRKRLPLRICNWLMTCGAILGNVWRPPLPVPPCWRARPADSRFWRRNPFIQPLPWPSAFNKRRRSENEMRNARRSNEAFSRLQLVASCTLHVASNRHPISFFARSIIFLFMEHQ